MKVNSKIALTVLLLACSLLGFSQYQANTDLLKPNPDKEKKFLPYLAAKHGGMAATDTWKSSNTIQYYKELWYFCESFYIKRNHLSEGITLNEEIIDISRFEASRKENEESIVILPGFKDALVLLPANKLVYKP